MRIWPVTSGRSRWSGRSTPPHKGTPARSIAHVSTDIGDLKAQARWANQIYNRYGYWTSVGSAIATWAVIANMN
jgi:hypothetical protein